MADIPGLDEFAQTRGADDLFDDEIIPVSTEEQQTIIEPERQSQAQAQSQPETQHVVDEKDVDREREESLTPVYSDGARSRGGERRGRGRGRGRGGRGRGAHDSGMGSGPRRPNWALNDPGDAGEENGAKAREGDEKEKAAETSAEKEEPGQEDNGAAEAPRVPAVRGDRSATGGVKKPKLTEEELSRRIAAAREKSAKVAAAHARAEADQASFMEREKIAEQKRREERANRRVMDNERERNRLRKLEALNGREWDADKPEEQFSGRGGRGQYRRGMHGGVSGYTRRVEESQGDGELDNDPQPHDYGHRYRGRGRTGRGRGGRGRGGHRGDRPDTPSQDKAARPTPVINNEEEFPSLPGGEKTGKESVQVSGESLKPLSPISGGTWADQVEAHEK
ncbi:hypothetical protein BDV10DRAFT_183728 [Aspergillus recurvatus]